MSNRGTHSAWKYHDGTKHSYWSIRRHPHFLDWANRPLPFKIYPKIEPLLLPRERPQTGVAVRSSMPTTRCARRADWGCGAPDLARLVCFTVVITNHHTYER